MRRENVLKVFTVLPILVSFVFMLFLPAEMPVHYGMNLQVTKYGSKYLLLITGGIALLLGIFLNFIYQAYRKTENEALVYRLALLALIIFNVINVLGLIGALVLS